uniref:Uncharacterized protein n=1 Tax=Cacopsylla melanoneura TaxID=428564 RepID=A0A8D8TAK6_9HEMI
MFTISRYLNNFIIITIVKFIPILPKIKVYLFNTSTYYSSNTSFKPLQRGKGSGVGMRGWKGAGVGDRREQGWVTEGRLQRRASFCLSAPSPSFIFLVYLYIIILVLRILLSFVFKHRKHY